MIEILEQDCFKVLPGLLSGSIDLILTDPPYNISQEIVINRGSQGKYKGQNISLDFGEFDHFISPAEYERFTEQWCRECYRLLKPGGFLISFFDKRKLSLIPDILEPLGAKTRDFITFLKSNAVPMVRKTKFAQATEMAVVMSKPGPNRFNWILGHHPNYIKLPIVGGRERSKDENGNTLHTTQKPIMLFRWLIDYFCEEDGWVLDPFAGVMTTAVAAAQANRNAICIEKNPVYVEAGRNRIVQDNMFKIDYKSRGYREKYL